MRTMQQSPVAMRHGTGMDGGQEHLVSSKVKLTGHVMTGNTSKVQF